MSWTELHPLILEYGRTTLAVGALVLLVLLIRRPFARRFGPKAAYALWLLPLMRFVTPPLPSNWALAGWLNIGTTNTPAPTSEMPIIIDRAGEVAELNGVVQPMIPPPLEMLPTVAPPTSLLEGVLAQTPLILTSVWIAGTLLWLGRSFYQQRQFMGLIHDDSEAVSLAISSETTKIARQLGMKRVPDVRASLLCSGPLVTGLKKPVVLLPLWFEDDYTRDEQRDALIHELTHLRRRDLWAFQIARIVAATQWFNPLAHIALNAFRTDQESACDADVLAHANVSPAAYGRTLVKAARLARPSDRRIAAASLTLAHPIKERLIMMQHPNPTLRSRLAGTALVAVLGSAAIFATASCTTAKADEPESRTFVFRSDHGDTDGRQMVLLSDPFAKLGPQLEAIGALEVPEFDMDFDFDFDVDGMNFATVITELEGLEDLEGLEALSELSDIMSFTSDGEGAHQVFVMKQGESESDYEVRIEAWAEDFEEKAEAWAERLEEQAEAMSLRIERDAEAWAEQHEAKIAAWEADIEARFGEDFEAEMEAAGEAIETLAEQCEARSEDDPTPEIVSAIDSATGETYKALCVNGDNETLQAQGLADWVQDRSDLTESEKAKFMDSRAHRQDIKITLGTFDHDASDEDREHIIIKRSVRTQQDELEGGEEN